MPYFKSSQEWLEQSTLLIEACPNTTRITTRYSIKAAPLRKPLKDASGDTETTDSSKPPRGSLVLTTYNPVSGVNLKYRTTKAAEVTRLMQAALGRLGRCMAGLPAEVLDETMPDAPAGTADGAEGDKQGSGTPTPVQQGQQAKSGGGKKKRKGRK